MNCDPGQCADGELAALSLAGRRDAFAEIMRRHEEPIYRMVMAYVGGREDALDLVQECFVSAFRALNRYDQARPLRAWLSRIAINKCRDWARRRAVRRMLFPVSLDQSGIDVVDSSPSTEVEAAGRQELELVRSAIAALPRNLKEPLVLHTIEGLTQAETAAVLNISEKAVETRIYRARRRLDGIRGAVGAEATG